MKNIKYIIFSTVIMLMLSACGNNGRVGNNGTSTNNGDNMIENTGDAIGDVGNGVAEGIEDMGNGVANGVNEMMGNENNNNNNNNNK